MIEEAHLAEKKHGKNEHIDVERCYLEEEPASRHHKQL